MEMIGILSINIGAASNLRCTVNGVGASKNLMKLKENTLATQIS